MTEALSLLTAFLAALQHEPVRPTDAALMEQLVRSNAEALAALYDRYARPVYALALRITRQPAAAEEIVQDVFLQLWRTADRFELTRALEPWLFTLARHRALDQLRTKTEKQRGREEALDELPLASAGPSPEQQADWAQRASRVRALMGELPEAQRRAIELAFFEGLTHSEIAAALGQPLGTVKSWIRSGLLRLREGLTP
jgi:RNA polymerase sigma-70 factor (ECF subfamily)